MRFLLIFLLLPPFFSLQAHSSEKLSALYNSLDRHSLSQLLAFYHVYSDTEQGKVALNRATKLINKHREQKVGETAGLLFSLENLEPIIHMITRQSSQPLSTLSKDDRTLIENIASHLENRSLKGFGITDEQELKKLNSHEIDLGRSLFLLQFGKNNLETINSYEAALDLMALQVLARLPKNPRKKEVMQAISNFIFHEMRFRFPPHSMWAKDVDLYTFLPSVLDSHHGVCLGVSILYLCIAQRLGVDLNIITPPGHIFLSYTDIDREINIETTARGIDYPTESYLSINTKTLVRRNLKEVLGLYFMNAAATAWHKKDHKAAIELYLKAMPFLADDPLIETFLGYNYLFLGNRRQGERYLRSAMKHPPIDSIGKETLIEDYFAGHVDASGIQAIYQEVDETRESILEKQSELKKICQKFPKFREGIFHIAVTWFQLGRSKEALETLKEYHALDPNNPTVEYYLSVLSMQRLKFQEAKKHYEQCEKILLSHGHFPKAMKQLKHQIRLAEPIR